MTGGLGKDKQVSEPSVFGSIIYTAQDKPFKSNMGFAVGIREELSDKSRPAACIKSPAWQKLLRLSYTLAQLRLDMYVTVGLKLMSNTRTVWLLRPVPTHLCTKLIPEGRTSCQQKRQNTAFTKMHFLLSLLDCIVSKTKHEPRPWITDRL